MRRLSWPISGGIEPVSWLLQASCRRLRPVRRPRAGGIVPLMSARLRFSLVTRRTPSIAPTSIPVQFERAVLASQLSAVVPRKGSRARGLWPPTASRSRRPTPDAGPDCARPCRSRKGTARRRAASAGPRTRRPPAQQARTTSSAALHAVRRRVGHHPSAVTDRRCIVFLLRHRLRGAAFNVKSKDTKLSVPVKMTEQLSTYYENLDSAAHPADERRNSAADVPGPLGRRAGGPTESSSAHRAARSPTPVSTSLAPNAPAFGQGASSSARWRG